MRPPDRDLLALVEGLRLPEPERSRLLEEIAGDVEALRDELVGRGMPPPLAHAEAVRLLFPSEAAVAALASVHEPLYRSLARRFSSGLRRAEWTGLVGVTVAALATAVFALLDSGLLRRPSPFLVPVLAVAVSVFTTAGRKAIQLFWERDHDGSGLRWGMPWLLVASGLAVLLAFAGAVFELWRLAARLEADPTLTGDLVVPWLLDTAVLVAAGLMTALVGGLAWFLLQEKIVAVEGADVRAVRAVRRAAAPLPLDPSLPSTGVPR